MTHFYEFESLMNMEAMHDIISYKNYIKVILSYESE
jgi:hypothetical protein